MLSNKQDRNTIAENNQGYLGQHSLSERIVNCLAECWAGTYTRCAVSAVAVEHHVSLIAFGADAAVLVALAAVYSTADARYAWIISITYHWSTDPHRISCRCMRYRSPSSHWDMGNKHLKSRDSILTYKSHKHQEPNKSSTAKHTRYSSQYW